MTLHPRIFLSLYLQYFSYYTELAWKVVKDLNFADIPLQKCTPDISTV